MGFLFSRKRAVQAIPGSGGAGAILFCLDLLFIALDSVVADTWLWSRKSFSSASVVVEAEFSKSVTTSSSSSITVAWCRNRTLRRLATASSASFFETRTGEEIAGQTGEGGTSISGFQWLLTATRSVGSFSGMLLSPMHCNIQYHTHSNGYYRWQ